MKKPIISVVINTKNVADVLGRCLESVKDFADEIIIMDMNSSDKTIQVAKKYTSKIFSTDKDYNYVEPARNLALEKAKGDWILVLDADEEVTPELMTELQNITQFETTKNQLAVEYGDCYFLPRKNLIFGKWIEKTGWWPDHQLRFFRNGYVVWSEQIHTPPNIKGKASYFPAREELAIVHHNYQSVSQFVERMNRYTSIEASLKEKSEGTVSFTSKDVITAFSEEFLWRFFSERGVEEGLHGTGLSYLQGTYQVLTILKNWENAGFPAGSKDQAETIASLEKFHQDLCYWIADWHVHHSSGWRKIYWQLRRRFRF